MDAELELEVGKLGAEQPRLPAALFGQRDVDGRITVHALLEVQNRMRVPSKEEQQCRTLTR